MGFVKEIGSKFLNFLIEKIWAQILTLSSGLYAFFIFLLSESETFAKNHIPIFFPIFILLLVSTICFSMKLYLSSRKKLTNQVLVDKKGNCYCSRCHKTLIVKQRGGYCAYSYFSCKCDDEFYPILDNGDEIMANEFYAFQKRHPQKELTNISYKKRKSNHTLRIER